MKKCDFCMGQVGFLGHEISKDELAVDLYKIKAMVKWESPKNASEIRSSLGLAGYYRRCVEGFATITTPLTKLTRKDAAFV